MDKMTRNEAIKYLKRKGKPQTEKEIKKVVTRGKIYGDPIFEAY